VIEPVRKRGLVALLKTIKPLEEDFSEIDDPVPCLLRHGPSNGYNPRHPPPAQPLVAALRARLSKNALKSANSTPLIKAWRTVGS
jgi:hypothetical protein